MQARRGFGAAALALLVALGLLSGAWVAATEPVCGELASNQLVAVTSNSAQAGMLLAQRFEVTYAVMVSSFSTSMANSSVTKAELYADVNGEPGSVLPNSSLVLPSYVGGGPGRLSTFTVPDAGGLYLAKGFYWFVAEASPANINWFYLDQPVSANESMPIALHGLASKSNPATSWGLFSRTFKFNVSGCDLTGMPSSTPWLSPSPSISPMISSSAIATPSIYPTATPSSTAWLSPSRSPSHSPQASLSPSPVRTASPTVVPLVNVTSSFDSSAASVINMSAPLSPAETEKVSVSSQLTGVALGNTSVPASALTGFTRTVLNQSNDETPGSATTYLYTAQVDNNTHIEQTFTFHSAQSSGEFLGTSFDIGAGSVKWSLNITTAEHAPAGDVTVRYLLSGMLSSAFGQTAASSADMVVRKSSNLPKANMTTYFLAFASANDNGGGGLAGCAVEVFDVALVDDVAVPIAHEVVKISSASSTTAAEFELVLTFPAPERSLVYDPSLSLGLLVGGGGRDELDGGSGGGDNLGMIIAVSVAVPVAVVVVVAAIVVGVLLIRRNKKRAIAKFRRSTMLSQRV